MQRSDVAIYVEASSVIIECWMGFYINDIPLWVEPDFIFFNCCYGKSIDEIAQINTPINKAILNLFEIPNWCSKIKDSEWALKLDFFINGSKVSFELNTLISGTVITKDGVKLLINKSNNNKRI